MFILSAIVICLFSIPISSYGFMKTKLVDQTSGTIIPLAAAQQEFLKYGSPQLMYVRPWNSNKVDDNRKLKLVYALARGPYYYFDFKGIDAITSKPLTLNGKEFKTFYQKLGDDHVQFKPLNNLSTALTEMQAKEMGIKEALRYGITVDDSYTYESHYNDNWMSLKESVYQINFTKKDNVSKKIINVVISINNGEILKFSYNSSSKNQASSKPALNWSESKDKAIAFAKNNFPEYAVSTVLMQNVPVEAENVKDYYFSFWRNIGGIIFPENNITVTIDAQSGEFVGYGYRWENITFPTETNNVIPQQTADKIFIDNIGIGLFNSIYRANTSDAAYIDCYSGELKNSFGEAAIKK